MDVVSIAVFIVYSNVFFFFFLQRLALCCISKIFLIKHVFKHVLKLNRVTQTWRRSASFNKSTRGIYGHFRNLKTFLALVVILVLWSAVEGLEDMELV